MQSTGVVVSGGIVHQALNKDNYERWKCVMQNYLEGQGLWEDIVEDVDTNRNEASKKIKDENAFHVFQLSCGCELLESIKLQQSSFNPLTSQNGAESSSTPDLEQGLWGIVRSASNIETKALWKTNDAKALHIIQLSCGREIVDEISHCKTSNEAWNYLSSKYNKELQATSGTEQDVLTHGLHEDHKKLFKMAERGDYIGKMIDASNVRITTTISKRTLLHVAVIAGNVKNVKKLVKKGGYELLCKKDRDGDTALALVARHSGNTDMAKYMLETKGGTCEKLAKSTVHKKKEPFHNMVDTAIAATLKGPSKKAAQNMVDKEKGPIHEMVVTSIASSSSSSTTKPPREELAKRIVDEQKEPIHEMTDTTTAATIKGSPREELAKSIVDEQKGPFHEILIDTSIANTVKSPSEELFHEDTSFAARIKAPRRKVVKNRAVDKKKGLIHQAITSKNPRDEQANIKTMFSGWIVETMNGPREKLLEIENNEKVIPILLAAANGYKELTTYLYSKTPSDAFNGDDSKINRVLLLSLCVTAGIFEVALKLLQSCNALAKESLLVQGLSVPTSLRKSLSLPTNISEFDPVEQSLSHKFSVLVALAKIPSAFPSGTRFSRCEHFIYNILSVEKEFIHNYKIHDIAKFVEKVTHVAVGFDEDPQKIDFRIPSGSSSIYKKIFEWFVIGARLSGWILYALMVLIFVVSPIKLLGLIRIIFFGIAYLILQSFKCLNIFGVRKIYDQKYSHYEVIGILNYFYRCIVELDGLHLEGALAYEAMLHAAQHGIIEFINAMREVHPDLLTAIDGCHRGIFSYAIMYRKQNVFQLIYYLQRRKEVFRSRVDTFDNNLLHLAAQLGPSSDRHSRSGAALEMQREFHWFKAVEKIVHPKFKEAKNCDGKKPYEIFSENHEELVKSGEKWAKDTATSYTIVGTLITTIMFAAAFTVPGGNNQDTGLPIFLHDYTFTMFLIADAISLFASATSVLIFIGILTSRYAEKDFLKTLPWKLLFGVMFLFLSICSMIIAFCAAIDMILKGYRTIKWFVVAPTMLVASIPIIIILLSQLRFMYEIFNSTSRNPIGPNKK